MSWPKLSAISALTSNPHVYLHLVPGTIKSSHVVKFVRRLRRYLSGYIFLFWDGLNVHCSAFTRKNLKPYTKKLKIYRLPAYAPECNPVEWLWGYLKGNALRGFCPPDVNALKVMIRKKVKNIRKRPRLIRSFFKACALSF